MIFEQVYEWDAVAAAWERWATEMEAGQAVLNEQMLSLAQLSRGMTVVELATGVGRFAERVAAEVGVSGRVVATDDSAEMIAYAKNRPADPARAPLTFRQLGLDDSAALNQTFDAGFCRFGLMFADDLVHTLSVVRGILRPSARFAAALWLAPQQVPLIGIAMRAALTAAGGPPPGAAEGPSPFEFTEPSDVAAAFREAGFTEVSFVETAVTRTFTSAREYAESSAAIAPPIARLIRAAESRREPILAAIEAAAARAFGTGEITLPGGAYCVAGKVPIRA
jgi:SAM-dependent methyltransferase